jgi:hypothetical protein
VIVLAADNKKKVSKKDEETVIEKIELQTDGYLLYRPPEEMGEDGEIEEEEPEVFVDEEGKVHHIENIY